MTVSNNDTTTTNTSGVSVTTTSLSSPNNQKYMYPSFIKGPSELGMSSNVNGWGLDTISTNFGSIIEYIELLVSGQSNSSKAVSIDGSQTGGSPLGNAYTFNTTLKCKSNKSGELVDAFGYINNIPLGNIPFISALGAGDVQGLRGLLPGLFEDCLLYTSDAADE